MIFEATNSLKTEILPRIKGGKILVLEGSESTILIVKQALHTELVTPGSAVGGQFDSDANEFYGIGTPEFRVPLDRADRHQAIKKRQSDVEQMLQIWDEADGMARTVAFLKILCQKIGFDHAKNIPFDMISGLTGTKSEEIALAWDRVLSIDVTDEVVFSELAEHHSAIIPSTSFAPSQLSRISITVPRKRKKTNFWLNWRFLLFFTSFLLTAIGLLIYTWFSSTTVQPTIVEVPIPNSIPEPKPISALGLIEPEGEVIFLSAPAVMEGSRVDKLLVSQGDQVQQGQVIAILDNRDRLQSVLEQAQQNVNVAAAKLQQVQAGSKTGDIKAQEAKYRGAQAELKGQINTQQAAIINLQNQLEGERRTQEALILQIKAELSNATQECLRYEQLIAGGAISQSQRDKVCLAQTTTSERLAQEKAALNRIITTREQQVRESQANLKRTIDTQENDIVASAGSRDAVSEVRPVDVQFANQELIAARAAVKKAEADLAQAFVRSSMNGQVLKINTWPGELVNQQKGILELGQTSQMYVNANVYETDIARIRKGQKATIRADKVVGKLTGYVDQVGLRIGTSNTLGTDPVKDADVRVVEVKIRLVPADSKKVRGLTNLQVSVVIDAKS